MEFGSLYDVLHNGNMILEEEIVFPIVRDIASGLRFLHNASPAVIHGDLKSRNVLVDSRFKAKVSDFGLSSHMGSKKERATGTPFWMAPELLRGESNNSCSSDMYSFGIVLYEIFSRKKPYHDQDSRVALGRIANKEAKYRPPVPTSCPNDVAVLMESCLADESDTRPTADYAHELLKNRQSESAKCNDALLLDLLPHNVLDALRDGRKLDMEAHKSVTIFFLDIVGYSDISSALSPEKARDFLDRLYSKLDRLCVLHHVFKVDNIGDAFMAVTNLAEKQPDHASLMARFALDALESVAGILIDENDPAKGHANVRIGFHSGPVAAHVVGSRQPVRLGETSFISPNF